MILLMGNLGNIFAIIFTIWFLPPIILLIIGVARWKNRRDSAKKFLIASVTYLLAGAGVCGALLYS